MIASVLLLVHLRQFAAFTVRSAVMPTEARRVAIARGTQHHASYLQMAKRSDALSRRRKRRGKPDNDVQIQNKASAPVEDRIDSVSVDTELGSSTLASTDAALKPQQPVTTPRAIDSITTAETAVPTLDSVPKTKPEKSDDGSSSLEDMFGLGDDQLRELNEQVLPLPREDLVTGKEVKQKDKDKVFKLPDLAEFMQETGGTSVRDKAKRGISEVDEADKIDRSDAAEYQRVLSLNPFADADETMFKEQYDIIPSIFGSGKLLGIPVPFLQSGHGILLIVTLLAALVYAPGNPLTEFPPEIRQFLTRSLIITYGINTVLAGQAFFQAKEKNLPAVFWALKTFILGGIAYYELSQAKDPNAYTGVRPTDRKSKRR